MQDGYHCEILSTVETIQIEPDLRLQTENDNSTGIQCRICLEETLPLIMPCKCDGTMKYVHQKCLKKWASQRVRKQIQKQEQKVKGKLSSIHGVSCELCKYNIAMQVKKVKKIESWKEAKENAQNYFLPFLSLVFLNASIALICLAAVVFIIIYSFLLVCKDPSVDYQKYQQHPIIIWCIICTSLLFSVIFFLKSMFELYHIFVKQQYDIIKVVNSMQQITQVSTQSSKNTLEIKNLKEFNMIQNGSTPATPMGDDGVFQNKLSLTRKKINQQKQLAKQIAKRRLLQLKQSPKLSNIPSLMSKQTSVK